MITLDLELQKIWQNSLNLYILYLMVVKIHRVLIL
nr:MAG TPA: hypothetical protein [Caudoviricetes sp.]